MASDAAGIKQFTLREAIAMNSMIKCCCRSQALPYAPILARTHSNTNTQIIHRSNNLPTVRMGFRAFGSHAYSAYAFNK